MKIFFFVSALIICIGCNDKKSQNRLSPDLISNPASASGNEKGALPVFEFPETRFHFGEVKEGEKVSHTFKFKNTGNADLIIADVSPSCGCTVPEWSKEPVRPGEEGKIDVTFNTAGKTGMQSKTISVLANTVPSTRVLTISAEINSQPK